MRVSESVVVVGMSEDREQQQQQGNEATEPTNERAKEIEKHHREIENTLDSAKFNKNIYQSKYDLPSHHSIFYSIYYLISMYLSRGERYSDFFDF